MGKRFQNRKRSQVLLGISYLIFSGLFFSMLFIGARYQPRDLSVYIKEISERILEFDYIFLYILTNAVLSFFMGIALISIKTVSRFSFNMLFSAALSLVILDIIPIGQEIVHLIENGSGKVPWTIIIFGFHTYLVFSFLSLRRSD